MTNRREPRTVSATLSSKLSNSAKKPLLPRRLNSALAWTSAGAPGADAPAAALAAGKSAQAPITRPKARRRIGADNTLRPMSLSDDFDGFLIALDGVVWIGREPIAGSVEALQALSAAGKGLVFVTNNPGRE